MLKKIRQVIINYALKDLLCSVQASEVLEARDNKLYLGKQPLSNEQLNTLVSEARFLESSRIWSILQETLKARANEVIFNKSTTFDDVMSGKLMLYNLREIEKIVNTILVIDKKR